MQNTKIQIQDMDMTIMKKESSKTYIQLLKEAQVIETLPPIVLFKPDPKNRLEMWV